MCVQSQQRAFSVLEHGVCSHRCNTLVQFKSGINMLQQFATFGTVLAAGNSDVHSY